MARSFKDLSDSELRQAYALVEAALPKIESQGTGWSRGAESLWSALFLISEHGIETKVPTRVIQLASIWVAFPSGSDAAQMTHPEIVAKIRSWLEEHREEYGSHEDAPR